MVNGEVVLETRGGRVDAVAVASPHILNARGATYAQSADWGVEEAEGFIKLFGMSSTLWAEVHSKSGNGEQGTGNGRCRAICCYLVCLGIWRSWCPSIRGLRRG